MISLARAHARARKEVSVRATADRDALLVLAALDASVAASCAACQPKG